MNISRSFEGETNQELTPSLSDKASPRNSAKHRPGQPRPDQQVIFDLGALGRRAKSKMYWRTSHVRQCIFVLAHFPSAPVHSDPFSGFSPNFVRPYLLHTISVLRKLGL